MATIKNYKVGDIVRVATDDKGNFNAPPMFEVLEIYDSMNRVKLRDRNGNVMMVKMDKVKKSQENIMRSNEITKSLDNVRGIVGRITDGLRVRKADWKNPDMKTNRNVSLPWIWFCKREMVTDGNVMLKVGDKLEQHKNGLFICVRGSCPGMEIYLTESEIKKYLRPVDSMPNTQKSQGVRKSDPITKSLDRVSALASSVKDMARKAMIQNVGPVALVRGARVSFVLHGQKYTGKVIKLKPYTAEIEADDTGGSIANVPYGDIRVLEKSMSVRKAKNNNTRAIMQAIKIRNQIELLQDNGKEDEAGDLEERLKDLESDYDLKWDDYQGYKFRKSMTVSKAIRSGDEVKIVGGRTGLKGREGEVVSVNGNMAIVEVYESGGSQITVNVSDIVRKGFTGTVYDRNGKKVKVTVPSKEDDEENEVEKSKEEEERAAAATAERERERRARALAALDQATEATENRRRAAAEKKRMIEMKRLGIKKKPEPKAEKATSSEDLKAYRKMIDGLKDSEKKRYAEQQRGVERAKKLALERNPKKAQKEKDSQSESVKKVYVERIGTLVPGIKVMEITPNYYPKGTILLVDEVLSGGKDVRVYEYGKQKKTHPEVLDVMDLKKPIN